MNETQMTCEFGEPCHACRDAGMCLGPSPTPQPVEGEWGPWQNSPDGAGTFRMEAPGTYEHSPRIQWANAAILNTQAERLTTMTTDRDWWRELTFQRQETILGLEERLRELTALVNDTRWAVEAVMGQGMADTSELLARYDALPTSIREA